MAGARALVVALALFTTAPALALTAGAASVEIGVPSGTPLAGYGGFPRRAWLPDVLGRHDHAFWFRSSTGVHDAPRVRALVLEQDGVRVLWLTVDLVGVDPSLVTELRARLARTGLAYSGVILSASHTHSGPGAYGESAVFGFVALDRLSPPVRHAIVDALERAARDAEARKEPARAGGGRAEVAGIARSRLAAPLDPALGLLKIVRPDGRPIALVWNYAIHGTALGRDNLRLSGDLMAEASSRIERELHAPALFVNGAVGDVSPVRRGWEGVRLAGTALATAALAAWDRIPAEDARLAILSERVSLPAPALRVRNCLGRWLPRWIEIGLGAVLPASTEISALTVGGTGWVTIPGELQTRLGLDVKAAGRGAFSHVFVAGVSNDYLGYFLTAEVFERPSYIACASLYGERGGEAIRDAANGLIRRLGRELR